jgi:predicted alpha/beta hydrolase family esterase
MKKVFIIHGFDGSPNGGWRPWLMGELDKIDIYACALAMPNPANPICDEWINEVARHVERNQEDQIYLVGHSLGVPTILRYLEQTGANNIQGAVLVSGPSEKNNNRKIDSFLDKSFDFGVIKSKAKQFSIIHGDNDPNVPLSNAEFLSDKLEGNLILVPNGGHLNGSSGWLSLPPVLEVLQKMFL